jgi:SAM-dependent methyltransferase
MSKRNLRRTAFYGGDLACLHDQHYSDLVANAAQQIIAMLRAAKVKSGLVCDLGCGGGRLSASLIQTGYEVVGVDISPAMIAIAKKRAARARFINGSIAEISLPVCDAAVAVGEVFNYLGSKTAIVRAFRNIFCALRTGGVLILDIKEPPPQRLARTSSRAGANWALIAEIEEDPIRNRLIRKIHSFRKIGGRYRRHSEVHELRIYPVAEVVGMLRAAGFHPRIFKGYRSYQLPSDRKVLLARKPPPNDN